VKKTGFKFNNVFGKMLDAVPHHRKILATICPCLVTSSQCVSHCVGMAAALQTSKW